MSKKKRNPKAFGEIEVEDTRPSYARKQHQGADRPHVGADIANLTVWAQRSVLGLKRGQLTPKERQHG